MTPQETRIAGFYDQLASSGKLMVKDIDFWIKEFGLITRGSPFLVDFGCGDGREVRLYQQVFGSLCGYYGLDLSSGMLRYVKSFAPDAKLVQANFNYLPFLDNSLPTVWATASYLHIDRDQIRKALAELFRVMTPNGHGFISLKANPNNQADYNRDLVTYYDLTEFACLLKRVGFDVPCKFWDPVRDPRGVAWQGYFFTKPE